MRLQKERTDQDKTIANLRKAIDGFGERMMKYESEKLQLEDKNDIAQKREDLEKMDKEKEKKILGNKIKLLENQNKKKSDELTEIKIK